MGRKPEQFTGVPQPLLPSQGGLPGTPAPPAPSPGLTHSLGPPALSLGSVLTHLPPCFCTWAKHCAHSLPECPPRAGLLGKLAPQEENLLDGKREELGQRIPHPFSLQGLCQRVLAPEAFQRTRTCLGCVFESVPSQPPDNMSLHISLCLRSLFPHILLPELALPKYKVSIQCLPQALLPGGPAGQGRVLFSLRL